jgi:hypothetical protein
VLIEIATGFVLLCGFKLADMPGLTVGETIGAGALVVLLPFGSLSGGP